MFSHLALLNHHKRIHTDGTDGQQHQPQTETIAVVNAQGLVQTQNIITDNGQMGQIQIVATEALEPATSVLQQAQQQHAAATTAVNANAAATNEVTINTQAGVKPLKLEQSKCITCGTHILQPIKRKGPKIVRCDTCMQNEQSAAVAVQQQQHQQQQPTQIFVAPDGEIKFEMNELPSGTSESSMDSLNAQNIMQQQITPVQIISTTGQTQAQLQQIVAQQQAGVGIASTSNSVKRENPSPPPPGHHPVKKRNTQHMTKCQKCNGSGVIYVNSSGLNSSSKSNQNQQQQQQNEQIGQPKTE